MNIESSTPIKVQLQIKIAQLTEHSSTIEDIAMAIELQLDEAKAELQRLETREVNEAKSFSSMATYASGFEAQFVYFSSKANCYDYAFSHTIDDHIFATFHILDCILRTQNISNMVFGLTTTK